MFRKIGILLSLLTVGGCAASPAYQEAKLMEQQRELMKQQHEASAVLMAQCRAGDVAACAYVAGGGAR